MAQDANEQVELLARIFWSRRFLRDDLAKIARKYGFTKREIFGWVDWGEVPDAIKKHFRDMAQREIESEEGS